jgi:hypothetical protein
MQLVDEMHNLEMVIQLEHSIQQSSTLNSMFNIQLCIQDLMLNEIQNYITGLLVILCKLWISQYGIFY